jgi:hypothetical protein
MLVVGFPVALVACGCAGSGRTTGSSNSQFALVRYMRSHGVPNLPDPSFPSGGGVFGGKIPGDRNAPAFAQAVRTCRKH